MISGAFFYTEFYAQALGVRLFIDGIIGGKIFSCECERLQPLANGGQGI
jgi:hypothetical protein